MANPNRTQGVHHIGLTVPDLARTAEFFIETLGFEKVGERPAYPAIFVSDGTIMITLWQCADPASATPFDRKANIGLHHFAIRMESQAALDDMHATLQGVDDVAIEFAPEPLSAGPTRHMMCAIPGGVRVELIAA